MWSPLILFEKAWSIESNSMVCISQLKLIYQTLQPNVQEIRGKERNGIHGRGVSYGFDKSREHTLCSVY